MTRPSRDYCVYELGGIGPSAIAEPTSTDEVVSQVDSSRKEAMRLVVFGGGTRVEEGNSLDAKRWTAVSTAGLTSPFDFSPSDMVVTAGAGVTLAELQSRLASENQYLPVDAPFAELTTLGG